MTSSSSRPVVSDPPPLAIRQTLAGERLFVTGATGFLGKVLVEKILWSVPDVGGLVLLVRADSGEEAAERVRDEILGAPIMARLRARHGEDWEEWFAGKVEAIAGDLGRDRFGLDAERYAALCRRIDRVVASAATVRFDERLDRATEINARGALRALELARDAGEVPLVQVSTCFVSGRRTGDVPETIVAPRPVADGETEPDRLLATLDSACREAREGANGKPGSVLETTMVTAGAEMAARHGFHDVYTLTKALAERLLERHRGAVPVAVVRPAIIESAIQEPIPGWIEAVRVTDPLLVAYGRGRTRKLPGSANLPLELIPVDYVANTLLAALVALRRGEGGLDVFQVGSSRHPIRLGELLTHAREGFRRRPLRDEKGRPVEPRAARFVEPDRMRRELEKRSRRARHLERIGRLRLPGAQKLASRLAAGGRIYRHFLHLIDVYSPYLRPGASYRDDATRSLWSRLSAEERALFPFDVTAIDWSSYIARIHVPGLVRFALRAETGAPEERPAPLPGEQPEVAARARAAGAETLFDLFAASARAEPEALAFQTFRDGRWLRYRYGQALTATGNLARDLAQRYGIGRGDRVVIWAGGSPEWVLLMLAVHRLGAVTVPLDPQWPADEVSEAARLVDARLVCAAPGLAEKLSAAELPVVRLAAPFVPEPDAPEIPGEPIPPPAGWSGDLATIVFTSGTTVAPKAVPLTHANFLANVRDLVPLMKLSRERLLSVLPMHHVFELMVGLLVPIAGISSVSYVAEIKPAEISWMMTTTRPTVLVAVPRLLQLLHNGIRQSVAAGGPVLGLLFRFLFLLSRLTGGRLGTRLFGKVHRRFGGSLRRIATGGSALEPELGRSFQLMGFQVAEGYGMTETSPVLTVNPFDAIRFGTVGKPLPGVEVEIRPRRESEELPDLGANGAGEIWVRGANVMTGYYANPEATAEVLEEGWLDTGDLGFFDDDGYLHVSGRSKDVIVTSAGKNVYPEEVERRYKDLPGVEELVVLGLPVNGAGAGERVSAVVVPRIGDGGAADLEAIRAAIVERSAEVPSYQRIAGVEIWHGALPKTTTLKVRRGRLREALLAGELIGAEGAASPAAPAVEDAPLDESSAWILETLARLTGSRAELLAPATPLDELGVDSLTRVELVAAIEARFGLRIDDSVAAGLVRVEDLLEL